MSRIDTPNDNLSKAQAIKAAVGTGDGDGVSTFDCFINYRVASDQILSVLGLVVTIKLW
jgi:hypothetical protein